LSYEQQQKRFPNSQSAIRNPKLTRLPRSFYLRPTVQVAKNLLGKYFIRKFRGATLVGKIVETEAYCGAIDPASHSFRGKTKRNEVMFGNGGFLYVYFTYGMHFCANVVTGPEGIGEAVLIRAVEPIEGMDVMMKNRFRVSSSEFRVISNLTNGPAKFCQAFAIGREQNRTDLRGDKLFIAARHTIPARKVGRSSRIGIRVGKEKQWRFFLKGSSWVSK
jgi:DNA-3-methyladenine glycosylase